MDGKREQDQKINEVLTSKLRNYPPILMSYYQKMIEDGKSYRTARNYIQALLQFINFRFGDQIPFDFYLEVSTKDIEDFLDSVRTKVSDGTPSNAAKALNWSVLNSFFQYLTPMHIQRNPLTSIARPSIDKTVEMVYISPDETLHMFENVRQLASPRMKNRDLSILMLGFYCGLNRAAIVQTNLDDIDWTNNKIRLYGKNETATTMPLSTTVMKQLSAWLEDRNHYFCLADTDALFVSQECHRLSGRMVADLVDKYSVGIGKHVTSQAMRNTCVINLYKETGDIRLCSQYLNHSNISTTQRYIEQLTSGGDIDSASSIIGKMFDAPPSPSPCKATDTLQLSQKEKCLILRQVRKEIAESNGIVYLSTVCTTTEDCTGNCPIIEAEIRYLDAEINRKIARGERFSLAGLTLRCTTNDESNVSDQSQPFKWEDDNFSGTRTHNNSKLSLGIDEIDLGTHAYTILKRLGAVTVKDIVELPKESLLQLQRWRKVYLEIKDKLQLMGLRFIHSEPGLVVDGEAKSGDPLQSETSVITVVEKTPDVPQKRYTMTIDELDLSVRAFNCLKRGNVNTVCDLINKTEDELLRMRNMTPKVVDEIQKKLEMMGLTLADCADNGRKVSIQPFPLKRVGINSVEELINKPEDEMHQVRNMGKKSLVEVQRKLEEMGLLLKESSDLDSKE